MLTWLKDMEGLSRQGLASKLSSAAVEGAEAARAEWEKRQRRTWVTDLGGMSLGKRPLAERLKLFRVAIRAGLIAFNQVRRGAA